MRLLIKAYVFTTVVILFFKQKKVAGGLEKAAEEAPNPIPPPKHKRSFFP